MTRTAEDSMPDAEMQTDRPLASSPSSRLILVGLALAGGLLLGACGDGNQAGSSDTAGRAAAGAQPTGTLALGDRTFAFRVAACDLGEVQDPEGTTLRGHGALEDGTRFTVQVDRGATGLGEIHSVSVHYGNVMSGSGFMAEAMRIQSELGWHGTADGASGDWDEPLVQIEGRTVRAEGPFEVDDAGAESVVEGRLEATCPPS